MRILAIRGENLASLGERFSIELEQEPLRSAGLFAITGETGAGKSTILDALCLALYDDFPRAGSHNPKERVLDASGDAILAKDPGNILRRGAGRGHAEVDFVARDGLRYRARCDLRRARNKASGALQNRGRSLWRIDEDGAVVATLESGVEPVNRRIVELTDLTFDQFRRTALLAQGDFDAFLRADAKERAELLEKITGAEIYGRLSKRAFDFAREAQQQLATLEQRRADIGVMPEEERAATAEEAERVTEQRAALAAERETTNAALRRHDALAQALAKLAQAESDCAAAAAAYEAVGPQRATLADLARVEPLRAPRDDVERAAKAFAEKREEAARALAQAHQAQQALDDAQARERAAGEALALIEAEIERLSPIWAQASELDLRIAALAQEEEKARRLAQEVAARAKEKQDEAAKILAQKAETEREREKADAEFARFASAQALSERWSEIDEWLGKRAEIAIAKTVAGERLRAALSELKRSEEMRAAFDAADEADCAARDALFAQLAERGAALGALGEADAQQRAEALTRAHDLLQALSGCAREHDRARAQAAASGVEVARFSQETEALAQQLENLRQTRDANAKQSDEAARLGELADAAVDQHALRLRAALEDDAPCPVCGGLEHPFAQAQDAAQKLVAELRARRDAARRALTQTDAEIAAASAREAKARALHGDAARRHAEAEAAAVRAEQDYGALLARQPHDAAPSSIEGALSQLVALIEKTSAEREEIAQKLTAARRLRGELDRLRAQYDEKRNAIEARRVDRDAAVALARNAGEERARFESAISGHGDRIESLDRSLAPFLKLCDLASVDLDRDFAGARGRLEKAGAHYRAAKDALEVLAAKSSTLALRAATLEAEARGAAASEAEARIAHEERRHDLAAMRAERAQLLGGEETAAHRARYEDRNRSAAAARETAREALTEAGKAKAACDERNARCGDDVAAAEAALSKARTAFARALEQTGFDAPAAASLLALAPEQTAAMRGEVEAALQALANSQAAVAARRKDVEEAQAAGPPETPREELAAHEAALAQQLDALATRLGVLQEKLTQDDKARAQAQALWNEIEAARTTRRLWDEINEAIGSATGDKFRRFAQSVTLEQLVALANQRLALLAPRYALERSGDVGALGLQIVDRDLGDERRSTRSLSGGERFLASLALALALAGLEGRDSFVDTLFIDEGFGALDSATLDVAVDALENLQGQGRKVGVISHVESMHQRIATKICVERRGGGVSVVRLRAPGYGA
ncbi:AAA family ATPase [Methylocystis sp. WRRC1]|uniref:AAA family ATPase n=1 Tax=Methylocystis sp. WRRC1 TaxID=1732014 RepID=UPI001D13CDA2|nr:AAA family ATPase [Methylocystis sp. WRRC1]MCC3247135.1 AAA family ATPase [Methylocystis sp. WRRC1]